MAVELVSNVKVITSGKTPTIANLTSGELAFGKLNKDGCYHLFGNADGSVVDIVLSTLQGSGGGGEGTIGTIDQVLKQGNTTNLLIEFNDLQGNIVRISPLGISINGDSGNTINISPVEGFEYNNFPVLTLDPNLERELSDAQKQVIRNIISTYSKDEIDDKLEELRSKLLWKEL